MNKITSFQTNKTIILPDWDDGLTKQEYESLVTGLMKACNSNINDFDVLLTNSVDDVVVNLELFHLSSYYEQTYKDIDKHNEVSESHLARIDTPESTEKHIMYKAGEILAHDIAERILNQNSK